MDNTSENAGDVIVSDFCNEDASLGFRFDNDTEIGESKK